MVGIVWRGRCRRYLRYEPVSWLASEVLNKGGVKSRVKLD